MFQQRLMPVQSLQQRQQLTQRQSLKLANHLLQMRVALISELRGEKYEPSARCPGCEHALTALEIRRGFSTDVRDFLTTCPKCHTRFQALLKTFYRSGSASVYFYCPAQTLDQLRGKAHLKPMQIDGSVRQSASYHFGGLVQAFTQIGIVYTLEVIPPWQDKVRDFLGQLPDTIIASIVGQKVSTIRGYRQKLGIRRYLASDHY